MKKILPVLLAFLIVFTLPVQAAGGKLTASAVTSGSKVTLTVRLDNPGIVATRIFVRYDAAVLELTGAKNGEVFPSGTFGNDLSANPYTMLWDESLRKDNNTTSGTLFTATFNVKGGTESGKTTVRIAVDAASTFDVDLNGVAVADCSCSVDVPVVTTKAGETTTKAATEKPTAGSTAAPKTTAASTPPASAKTTSAAKTTAQTAKPAVTTTKPPITASGQKTTRNLPDEIASAVSSAASAAASVKEKTTASAAVPSTAKNGSSIGSAGTNETTAAAVDADVTAGSASGETTPDLLPADGTLSTVSESLTDTVIIDPPAPTNHRGLLWLLLLIPAAAAVILIVKKKKA